MRLSPPTMNFPLINNFAILEDVIVRMLRGGQTRMVSEDPYAISDLETVERITTASVDLAVLL